MPKKVLTRDKKGAWLRTSTPLPAEKAQKEKVTKASDFLAKPDDATSTKTAKSSAKANKE